LTGCTTALLQVGCSGAAATPSPATPAPAVTQREPGDLGDAGLEAAVIDNIRVLYSGSDWYPFLQRANGTLDVAARDGVVFVAGVPPAMADAACRSIAAASFDEDARPLGILAVVMVYGEEGVAQCEPP
jgi:hypothetical protein